MDIEKTLEERGKKYGEFKDHAKISQHIKHAMKNTFGWANLSEDKQECLEMIAHKIARILNGDPEYLDNWHDIIGYTRLVEKNIEKRLANSLNWQAQVQMCVEPQQQELKL